MVESGVWRARLSSSQFERAVLEDDGGGAGGEVASMGEWSIRKPSLSSSPRDRRILAFRPMKGQNIMAVEKDSRISKPNATPKS